MGRRRQYAARIVVRHSYSARGDGDCIPVHLWGIDRPANYFGYQWWDVKCWYDRPTDMDGSIGIIIIIVVVVRIIATNG